MMQVGDRRHLVANLLSFTASPRILLYCSGKFIKDLYSRLGNQLWVSYAQNEIKPYSRCQKF